MKFYKSLGVLSLFLPLVSSAQASGEKGNGGGAWVCRDSGTKAVRWVKLVDTFESASDPRISARFSMDGVTAANAVVTRLSRAGYSKVQLVDPSRSAAACPYFIGKVPCGMGVDDSGMVLPDDASIRFVPAPESCTEGVITREAVALRTNGFNITLIPSLYQKLTGSEQVALAAHEMLYAFSDFFEGDTTSDRIRPLAAKLVADQEPSFSPDEQNLLGKANGIPSLERYFKIELEYDDVNTDYFPKVAFESINANFAKNNCVQVGAAGSYLESRKYEFRCTYFGSTDFPVTDAIFVATFPSQFFKEQTTRQYHFVATGLGGVIAEDEGQVEYDRKNRYIYKHLPLIVSNILN